MNKRKTVRSRNKSGFRKNRTIRGGGRTREYLKSLIKSLIKKDAVIHSFSNQSIKENRIKSTLYHNSTVNKKHLLFDAKKDIKTLIDKLNEKYNTLLNTATEDELIVLILYKYYIEYIEYIMMVKNTYKVKIEKIQNIRDAIDYVNNDKTIILRDEYKTLMEKMKDNIDGYFQQIDFDRENKYYKLVRETDGYYINYFKKKNKDEITSTI